MTCNMLAACMLLVLFSLELSTADHFRDSDVCRFYKQSCNYFEILKGCCEQGLTAGEITCIVLAVAIIIVGIIVICMFCRGCPIYNMRHKPTGGKIFSTSLAPAAPTEASAPPVRAVTTTVVYPDWQRSQEYPAYPMPTGNQCSTQQFPDTPPEYTPSKHHQNE